MALKRWESGEPRPCREKGRQPGMDAGRKHRQDDNPDPPDRALGQEVIHSRIKTESSPPFPSFAFFFPSFLPTFPLCSPSASQASCFPQVKHKACLGFSPDPRKLPRGDPVITDLAPTRFSSVLIENLLRRGWGGVGGIWQFHRKKRV